MRRQDYANVPLVLRLLLGVQSGRAEDLIGNVAKRIYLPIHYSGNPSRAAA